MRYDMDTGINALALTAGRTISLIYRCVLVIKRDL